MIGTDRLETELYDYVGIWFMFLIVKSAFGHISQKTQIAQD